MFQTLARAMTAPDDTLKIECGTCGHKVVWSRKLAFDRLGADACPYIARRKLICGQCGKRDEASFSI